MQSTDEQLMLALKQGDRQALNGLVDRYRDRIVAFAYRMTGCADSAQDMAQETFVRVYKGARTFQDNGRFSPWLYKIATNVCLSEYARKTKVAVSLDTGGLEAMQDTGPSVQDTAMNMVDADRVQCSLSALNEDHRNVLVMHIFQGLTYVEIGQALGIPTGTVKSRLFYAIRKLRGLVDLE